MKILRTNQKLRKFFILYVILPCILLLQSGFIEEKNPMYIASLDHEMRYPLNKPYEDSNKFIPHTGKIALSHDVSSFFDTFRKSVTGFLPEDEQIASPEKLIIHEMKTNEPKLKIFLARLSGDNDGFSSLRKKRTEYFVDVANMKSPLNERKRQYLSYIDLYANKYELNHNMIYSIISVESNFRPLAKSRKNAYGLMQVVASTAGTEVNRYLKKKGKPKRGELLHPKTNIEYGTTYIYLVRKYHLAGIKNPKSRDILLIASYNAGAGAVMRHFGKTRTKAIKQINSMTPETILKSMLTSFRSGETRRYLEKVLMGMQTASL